MSTGRFIREAVRSGQFRPQYLGRMTTAQIAALVPANYRSGTTVTCTDGVNAEREYKLQAGSFGVDGAGNSGLASFRPRINPAPLAVMAAPPTITLANEADAAWTGSTLATGRQYFANNNATDASNVAGSLGGISVLRAARPITAGVAYPNYLYTKWETAENVIGAYSNLAITFALRHTGTKLALRLKGVSGTVFVRVGDEFATLTPLAIPNDGAVKVVIVDFGSADTRDVYLMGQALNVRGIAVDATDTVEPLLARGPRTCVLSDSLGEGTGSDVAQFLSWITYAGLALDWDDVISCAAGSTGLLADAAGTKRRYIDRLARDVIPLLPELVVVQPSTNDATRTAAEVLAAAQELYAALVINIPGVTVVITSPSISSGAGAIANAGSLRLHNAALRGWCATQKIPFVDWIEQPMPANQATLHTTTLTSAPGLGATSFTTAAPLVAGGNYKFPDGTACYVRSVSGFTATVDNVPAAQVLGSTITQCGPCIFTGTGRTGTLTGWGNADLCIKGDGVGGAGLHWLNAGHRLVGETFARQLVALSNS